MSNPDDVTQQTQRQQHLARLLHSYGSVAVALSGGVDSSYLLAVCVDTLGAANVLAVTATSPAVPPREVAAARAVAQQVGAQHVLLPTTELDNADYARNDGTRCLHCKTTLYRAMQPLLAQHGLRVLVNGANADDVGDHRPGMQAARAFGVQSPLLRAGLTKHDIRTLAQQRGLPTHAKPAQACLASRIAYGRPVTAAALAQVVQAEDYLRDVVGLQQVRVRHHGEIARIEVEPADLPHLVAPAVRAGLVAQLHALGFTYVTLDLAGFQSGSMNAMLPAADLIPLRTDTD